MNSSEFCINCRDLPICEEIESEDQDTEILACDYKWFIRTWKCCICGKEIPSAICMVFHGVWFDYCQNCFEILTENIDNV